MIPDLSGQTVIKVQIDLGLLIWTAEGWEIQLNGDTYLSRAGEAIKIDNTGSTDALPQGLSQLVGRRITSFRVSDSGQLSLSVDDATLTVDANLDGEAWQLGGPRGAMVVCRPGGGLEIWGQRAE